MTCPSGTCSLPVPDLSRRPPVTPDPTAAMTAAEDDGRALLSRAVAGDREAIGVLLAQVRPSLVRYCRARLGRAHGSYEAADDVAQEVLLAVLTALPRYRDEGRPFAAFVYGVAAHKVADHHRAAVRRPMPVADVPESADVPSAPRTLAMRSADADTARALLDLLPEPQRELILLRVAAGLSAEETGAVLGHDCRCRTGGAAPRPDQAPLPSREGGAPMSEAPTPPSPACGPPTSLLDALAAGGLRRGRPRASDALIRSGRRRLQPPDPSVCAAPGPPAGSPAAAAWLPRTSIAAAAVDRRAVHRRRRSRQRQGRPDQPAVPAAPGAHRTATARRLAAAGARDQEPAPLGRQGARLAAGSRALSRTSTLPPRPAAQGRGPRRSARRWPPQWTAISRQRQGQGQRHAHPDAGHAGQQPARRRHRRALGTPAVPTTTPPPALTSARGTAAGGAARRPRLRRLRPPVSDPRPG